MSTLILSLPEPVEGSEGVRRLTLSPSVLYILTPPNPLLLEGELSSPTPLLIVGELISIYSEAGLGVIVYEGV
jgi:hypothetical protein